MIRHSRAWIGGLVSAVALLFLTAASPISNPADLSSVAQDVCTSDPNGGCIQNEAASVTNPTLIPDKTDLDTGIGGDGANSLSLIAGGNESLRLIATGVGSNVFVDDLFGIVIGHTAKLNIGGTAQLQILGTTSSDSAQVIGRWGNNATAPKLSFFKSRAANIGSSGIVNDNDIVGMFRFCPDDGTVPILAAQYSVEVDDASPAVGDIGMAFVWEQMPGDGGALKETMRLAAKGNLGIGVAPNVNRQLDLAGAFSGNTRLSISDTLTASGEAQQLFVGGTIDMDAAVGADAHGLRIAPTLEEAASGTHVNFTSLIVVPPSITSDVAALTNASTVKITGDPTGGTNNFGLWNVGTSRFDGDVTVNAIVSSSPTLISVDAATTFGISRNAHTLDCIGAESINTITGGLSGQLLTIIFTDAECTLVDDDDPTAANAMNLAGNITGGVDDTITLIFNGSHWIKAALSVN